MVIGYIFIAFIVFFFMWKKYALPSIEKKGRYDAWIETPGFHKAVWGSIFWIVTLPMMLAWGLLEKINNKLTSKNN